MRTLPPHPAPDAATQREMQSQPTLSGSGICGMLSEPSLSETFHGMNQPTPQHPFKSRGFFTSLSCALSGLALVFQTERNFRIHLMLTSAVIAAGLYFHVSRTEWILLTLCITLMLAVEVLNTALEYLVDIWADGTYRERARQVKDIAAGACLVTAVGTAITGVLIFLPHLLALVSGVSH